MKPGRKFQLRLALLLALALSGCCSPEPIAPLDPSILAPGAAEEAALSERFRKMRLPFEGFAAVEPEGEWRVGDELLYGVEYSDGDERDAWILGLRVMSRPFPVGELMVLLGNDSEESTVSVHRGAQFSIELTDSRGRVHRFTSDSILVAASTFDESGEQLEQKISVVPQAYLTGGFREACELFRDGAFPAGSADSLSEDEVGRYGEALASALAAMLTLFRTLEQNEAMAKILWKIVDRPSVFSVIVRGGATANLSPRFELSEVETRDLSGRPPHAVAHRFPIDIDVNGKAALRALLSIVDSDCPLRVGAGLLAIDGQHPRNPDRRVRVRLLATRRGAEVGEQESTPAGEILAPRKNDR